MYPDLANVFNEIGKDFIRLALNAESNEETLLTIYTKFTALKDSIDDLYDVITSKVLRDAIKIDENTDLNSTNVVNEYLDNQ